MRVWHVAVARQAGREATSKLAWNANGRTVDDRDDSVVAKEKSCACSEKLDWSLFLTCPCSTTASPSNPSLLSVKPQGYLQSANSRGTVTVSTYTYTYVHYNDAGTYCTTHAQPDSAATAQQQHHSTSKMSHRIQLRLRRAKQGFWMVASRCLPFCRPRKFIKDREIRQS